MSICAKLSARQGIQAQVKGPFGETGATFIPAVSDEGVISWTNDRELPNPDPVNIRGPQGEKGEKGDPGDAASLDETLSIAGQAADAGAVGDALAEKISRSGDTLRGTLTVSDEQGQTVGFAVSRTNGDTVTQGDLVMSPDNYTALRYWENGSCENSMMLRSDQTEFLKPVAVSSGGTGAATAAGALTNLGLTATAAELNCLGGVTSAVQTQLNGKAVLAHGESNALTTHITGGFYRVDAPADLPNTGCKYGQLIVARGSGDTIGQILIPYGTSGMYVRSGSGVGSDSMSLNDWVQVLTTGNTGMTLLWTNASASNFAAQTISLSLSGYSHILVLYRTHAESSAAISSVIAKVGTTGDMHAVVGKLERRTFTSSSTGVEFAAAKYYATYAATTVTEDTYWCVPYQIYGIKGVGL